MEVDALAWSVRLGCGVVRSARANPHGVRAAREDDRWLARLDSFAPDASFVWRQDQWELLLEHVWWRDLGRCGICGEEVPLVGAELDWIIPAALGKLDLVEGSARAGTTFQSRRHRRQNLQAAHPGCAEGKAGVCEIVAWRSAFMAQVDAAEGLFAAGSLWLPAFPVDLPDDAAATLHESRARNWAAYESDRASVGGPLLLAGRPRRGVARTVDMLIAGTAMSLIPNWQPLDDALGDVHYGFIMAAVWALYEWPQTALWGRTLGKRLAGIRLVTTGARSRLGWVRAALRLALPLSAVAWWSWAGVAAAAVLYATCLLNPGRRGLHDLVGRSEVVLS